MLQMKLKDKYQKEINTVEKLLNLAESTTSSNEKEAAKNKAKEILIKIKDKELST